MNGDFGKHSRFYFHKPVSWLIVLSVTMQRSHNYLRIYFHEMLLFCEIRENIVP